MLDIQAFERLLGPCKELLERNIDLYAAELNQILSFVKQAEDQAFTDRFGSMLQGSRFGKQGDVVDMTGKKLDPESQVMHEAFGKMATGWTYLMYRTFYDVSGNGNSAIEKVLYPGLEDHPTFFIAKKQMTNGFGGMISIKMNGGSKMAKKMSFWAKNDVICQK